MDTHIDTHWIPLAEYSNRYKVSVSTLRRRIKAGLMPVRLQAGKYFLKVDKMSNPPTPSKLPIFNPPAYKPPPLLTPEMSSDGYHKSSEENLPPQKGAFVLKKLQIMLHKNEKVLNKLLHFQEDQQAQLKEKDKQIKEQKNQISDLKTLLSLLEGENKELKSFVSSHPKEAPL